MKKVIFGLIWAVVLYFGACMLTGAIVGGMAGSKDPQHAAEAGARAAQQTVPPLRPYFAVGAIVFAVVGASQGVLPGTKTEK